MRLALFGDMHGNCVALDAVLEDFGRREIEESICLGDTIQGGPEPVRILEKLTDLRCPVILGNGDAFVRSGIVSEESVEGQPSEGTRRVRDWTLEQIGTEGGEVLKTFSRTHTVDLGDGRSLLGFHGAPGSYDTVMLPEVAWSEVREAYESEAEYLAGGHTHLQWVRRIGPRTFLNPGSAGVAYNRYMTPETFYCYPIAQYAILDTSAEDVSIEFVTVPFDPAKVEEITLASGHPFAASESRRYFPR